MGKGVYAPRVWLQYVNTQRRPFVFCPFFLLRSCAEDNVVGRLRDGIVRRRLSQISLEEPLPVERGGVEHGQRAHAVAALANQRVCRKEMKREQQHGNSKRRAHRSRAAAS